MPAQTIVETAKFKNMYESIINDLDGYIKNLCASYQKNVMPYEDLYSYALEAIFNCLRKEYEPLGVYYFTNIDFDDYDHMKYQCMNAIKWKFADLYDHEVKVRKEQSIETLPYYQERDSLFNSLIEHYFQDEEFDQLCLSLLEGASQIEANDRKMVGFTKFLQFMIKPDPAFVENYETYKQLFKYDDSKYLNFHPKVVMELLNIPTKKFKLFMKKIIYLFELNEIEVPKSIKLQFNC